MTEKIYVEKLRPQNLRQRSFKVTFPKEEDIPADNEKLFDKLEEVCGEYLFGCTLKREGRTVFYNGWID